MAAKVYDMTYEGIKKLQEELEKRKTVVAADVAERLKEARSLGDLSENSEYDDAKNAQAENEHRIMEIENILKNAQVIDEDDISKTRVTLGALVKIRDEETLEEQNYVLVGNKEEDIFNNRISSESPVGAAIVGKKKGEIVDVRTPAGILRYKIVKISKPG
ncbi:MAG: transcription elongation factor GreA [Saccharofermentanales bacterium]|nr:transcription elongation factor GreA [Clostridiaceae bacterium]